MKISYFSLSPRYSQTHLPSICTPHQHVRDNQQISNARPTQVYGSRFPNRTRVRTKSCVRQAKSITTPYLSASLTPPTSSSTTPSHQVSDPDISGSNLLRIIMF